MARHAKLARQLADITALDLSGDPVRLGSYWSESPAVLVFVRHFG